MRRQRAACHRNQLLAGETARDREGRNDEEESRHQHVDAECQVVPGGVGAYSRKGAAVIAATARIGVQDF